jgi:DNA-binding GntR family transcriptional regulator
MTATATTTDTLTSATITAWTNNGGITKQVAAHIARQILSGRYLPYAKLPPNETLAKEWHASERTIIRAKSLLAQHGALLKEDGIYYVVA